jgi:TatA/E family protein of Tat protein translocase
MPILLFLDISTGELIVIVLAAFLIFGPRKLPEIARQFGKGMNEIRRVTNDIKREIREESNRLEDLDKPVTPPAPPPPVANDSPADKEEKS